MSAPQSRYRILFHCPKKRIGGSQLLLATLKRELGSRGHSVLEVGEEDMEAGFTAFQPDFIFFSNSPHPIAAKEIAGTDTITVEIVQSNRKLESEALYYPPDFTDHHVFVSESARRFFHTPLDDSRATVIPNGVDLFPTPPSRPAGRSPLTVLSVGSTRAIGKNAGDLEKVALRADPSTFRFIHAGGGEEGAECFSRLLAKHSGVDFTHIPWTDRISNLYRDADVFVSFSIHEGFGLAIAEAADAGLPILLRRCHGISDRLEDGNAALFCDSIEDFHSTLVRLQGNPELRSALGSSARALIRSEFTTGLMVDRYEDLMWRLRGPGASGTPAAE